MLQVQQDFGKASQHDAAQVSTEPEVRCVRCLSVHSLWHAGQTKSITFQIVTFKADS